MAQVESNISVDIPKRNILGLSNDIKISPDGTLFSTTPGGTRIIYERNFLLKFRSSPIAKTPPSNLPFIAGVTKSELVKENKLPMKWSENDMNKANKARSTKRSDSENNEEPQFSMEM